MKIICDGVEVVSLSDMQMKVLAHMIPNDELNSDLKRRVSWVLNHKYAQCLQALRAEFEPKLKAGGAQSIPCDDEEFCRMVFAREDYKDRAARDRAASLDNK